MADSTVTIVGNLTRDPELRFTAGGKGVASFGVAVNRRYQVNGEWQEKVSFFNVTAWDQLGENAAASLTKGARIIVTGRLEQREYETTARSLPTSSGQVCVGPVPRSSARSAPAPTAPPRPAIGRPHRPPPVAAAPVILCTATKSRSDPVTIDPRKTPR